MADDILNGETSGESLQAQPQQAGAAFTVEKIYVKDVSFEAPNAPQIFNEQGQPELQMNLNQKVQRLGEAAFEVVLGVTLTCNVNGKTAYLAEVQQAGVFGLSGFEDAGIDAMLGTQCPNLLYPYAAAAIGQLVQTGGFPPFFLQPLNFDALYAENLRQRAMQQSAANTGNADLAGTETAGNA
jgi:preprotein translocase subunit SecB